MSHTRRPPMVAALVALLAVSGCIAEDSPADAGAGPDARPAARDMRVDPPPDGAPVDAEAPVEDGPPPMRDAEPDGPALPACGNGLDDDGDGRVDLDDPGCADATGADEADPAEPPVCANGIDEDDDGLVDWPDDPDCRAAGAASEGGICGALDGMPRAVTPLPLDTPTEVLLRAGDVVAEATCGAAVGPAAIARLDPAPGAGRLLIEADPPERVRLFARARCRERPSELGCRAADRVDPLAVTVDAGDAPFVFVQPTEGVLPRRLSLVARFEPVADACRNGLDDDGDGRIDQADPGCSSRDDPDEADPAVLPECGNGIDDDRDGATDWPDDSDCEAAGGAIEGQVCGGIETVELGLGDHRLEFELDSAEAGTTRGRCGGNGAERVALLVLDEPAALDARVVSPEAGSVATYLRTDCDSPRTETLCDAASAVRVLTVPRLPAGRYALFFDHDPGFEPRVDAVVAEIRLQAVAPRACENGLDDDGDGLIDAADPGCYAGADRDEADPEVAASCADGLDNDGDGAVDHPADASCRAAGSAAEGAGCPGGPVVPVGLAGGVFALDPRPFDPGHAIARCGGDRGAEVVFAVDLPGPADVRVVPRLGADVRVFARADCADAASELGCADEDGELVLGRRPAGRFFVFAEPGERPAEVEFVVDPLIRDCNDGLDNDGDGRVDLADPGCSDGFGRSELDPDVPPACFDGIDNDGDGAVDWPDDPECAAAGGAAEDFICPPFDDLIAVPPEGGIFETDTRNRPDHFGAACAGRARGGEQVLVLSLDAPTEVDIEVIEADYDTALFVRQSCLDDAPERLCDDDGGAGTLSRLRDRLPAGIWYVFVDGFNDSRGTARVQVRF